MHVQTCVGNVTGGCCNRQVLYDDESEDRDLCSSPKTSTYATEPQRSGRLIFLSCAIKMQIDHQYALCDLNIIHLHGKGALY